MSSNINPNNIDGTYPIAGQDNSSQGFRDNFTNIRNNFSYAQSEINDLQSKALVTSALSGSTLTNNMGYNAIRNAQLFSPSYTLLNLGSPIAGGTIVLDYSQGSYQQISTTGNYSFSFTNWPTAGQLGQLTLIVNVTSTSHVLTFPSSVSGINDIAGGNAINQSITFDQTGLWAFRFESIDAGTTIYISDLRRNFSTIRDPNFYWDDQTVPTFMLGYGANQVGFQTALALESGLDIISALGSYNSATVGNLALATINSTSVDTGQLGGYSVTGIRGNLQTATVSAAVSGDILGYFNGITFTGNGVTNVPQQVASIGMYTNGPNASAGLGGNVGIFTHTPGGATNVLTQAVGFENDQSARYFGNIILSATSGGGSGTSSYVPATSSGTGTVGQVAWNQSYLYICTATNTWKRIALATF